MIKADRWIKRQCEKPTHVIYRYHDDIGASKVPYEPLQVFTPTNEDHLELVKLCSKAAGNNVGLAIDTDVKALGWKPMISPYVEGQVRQVEGRKIVSYGTSSYGYDVRLGEDFKIFTNINNGLIDPLNMDPKCYVDHRGDSCIIPPNSYILGHTVETFCIPRDVMVVCVGKSTYARAGAIINVTPIEAGFEGQVVIEISNATNLPLKVHAGMGIAQFLFYQSDEVCEVSYADRGGKYQNQRGIQVAIV